MANKRNKDSLKRREEKRRTKSVARKTQARSLRSNCGRGPGLSEFELEYGALPKLSAVIWDYAEPLLNEARGPTARENAAALSMFCWNASLLPLDKGREQIERAIDRMVKGDKELKQDMLTIFEMMHARKQLHFANDRRFIIDYHMTRNADSLSLHVISTHLMPSYGDELIRLPEPISELTPRVRQSA
jgi:hypothetical protein